MYAICQLLFEPLNQSKINIDYIISSCLLFWSIDKYNNLNNIERILLIDIKYYNKISKYDRILKLLDVCVDKIIPINLINYNTDKGSKWKRFKDNYRWLNLCFNKLLILTLSNYDKVLFMDSDMLCINKFIDIFNLKCPAGVLTDNDHKGYITGHKITKEELNKSVINSYGISGAFILVKPNYTKYKEAINKLEDSLNNSKYGIYQETIEGIDYDLKKKINAGPDEIIFSFLYKGNKNTKYTNWLSISRLYNCIPWHKDLYESKKILPYYNEEKNDFNYLDKNGVKILHYASTKPFDILSNKIKDKLYDDIILWFNYLKEMIKDIFKININITYNDIVDYFLIK